MSYLDEFNKRFSLAKQRKTNWVSILEEAYGLFLPNRQTMNQQVAGQEKQYNLFDTTGVNALQQFSNTLKQSIVPSHQEWATLKPSPKLEMEVSLGLANKSELDELSRMLGVLGKGMFQYIWQSNFDVAVHEAIQDMAISTGAMLILDTGKASSPLRFVSVPANQLYIEPCSDGVVKTVFREHKVTVRELYGMFPHAERDHNIDSMLVSNPAQEVDVIEGTLWQEEEQLYKYCVHIKAAERKMFYESYYEVSPWVIFRSNVAPDEVFGRGAGIQSLPAMRVLNKMTEQNLYNNDMAINPPLVVDVCATGLDISNVNVNPNSILPYSSAEGMSGQPYSYLQTGASFNVGMQGTAEYRSQIMEAFHLANLGDLDGSGRTATEITIRNNKAIAQQAAMFGRLQTELVNQIVKRVYFILSNYDENFPKAFSLDSKAIEIVASSPLARVQDMQDLEGTMQFLNLAMSLGEMGQTMFASNVDVSQLGNFIATKMGVPAQLMLSVEQRNELAQQVNQVVQNRALQQPEVNNNVQ